MNEEGRVAPVKSTSMMRRLIIGGGVLLLVFLLGFVPMWLKARAATGSLAEAERQLTLARTQDQLSSAAIDARRGDYEPARLAASQFFISLSAGMDGKGATAFAPTQREGLQALFAGRDEVITLLARSDPASADRLSDLYVSYRKAMHD
jgi:hypothetical protein